jgi:hypothetical protein
MISDTMVPGAFLVDAIPACKAAEVRLSVSLIVLFSEEYSTEPAIPNIPRHREGRESHDGENGISTLSASQERNGLHFHWSQQRKWLIICRQIMGRIGPPSLAIF